MTRDYPQFIWGKGISVERCGEQLKVFAVSPVSQGDIAASADPLQAYRNTVKHFGPKRQGKNSPHIQFANANSDEKLIRFIQRFGPVVVSSFRTEQVTIHSGGLADSRTRRRVLEAQQDLNELRNERQIYRAALTLVSELKRQGALHIPTIQGCIGEIAERASGWPSQWQRERQLRSKGLGLTRQPNWFFGADNVGHLDTWNFYATRERDEPFDFTVTGPFEAGHHVICELVNAFSPVVYPWDGAPVEAPNWDLAGGIRPVLYYILRREYLHASGVGVCRNTECRELFEIERSGQEFCGDVCSRHQRQREYRQKSGKKVRQRRLKGKKPTSRRPSR